MASPYTSPTLIGYNATPPSDDGSTVAANQLTWQKHLDKIGNPLRTYIDEINTNVQAAFSAIYDQTDAENAALVTPTNFHYPEMYVERYGSTARTAIAAALAVAAARGDGVIHFEAGKDYDLGDCDSTEDIFAVTGLANVVIEGNFARLVCNSTGNFQPKIFKFTNPNNITINNLRGIDNGTDLSVSLPGETLRGAWLFYFVGSGSAARHGNINIVNCHGEDLVAFVACGEASAARIVNLHIDPSCSLKNVFYGTALRNNGDNVTGGYQSWNVRRAVIAYGVTGMNLDLPVYLDSDALDAESVCLLKCYDSGYPFRNAKLRVSISGDLTDFVGDYVVGLEHDTATGDDGLIENVDVDVNLVGVTAGNIRPVKLTAYSNSVQETTTTDSVWRHLRFAGDIEHYVSQTGAPENLVPIHATVAPSSECDIILGPSLVKSWAPITYADGFVLKTAADRETRFVAGDLTGKTVVIPLAGLDQQNFVLKLRVWANDNYDTLTPQNSTYEERLIAGQNADAGNVSIEHNTTLARIVHGSGSTIAYAASGENINVTFNTYNSAKARARVDAEFVSVFPNRL